MTTNSGLKTYKQDRISLQHNNKTGEAGTIDIFRGCKGCELGKTAGICYAAKGAARTGIDFFQPIRRHFSKKFLQDQLKKYKLDWVRIGCISDPSLDWTTTCEVVDLVRQANKTPVIITKCFETPIESHLESLAANKTILQISVCGMTPLGKLKDRQRVADQAMKKGIKVGWRINSAVWKNKSAAKTQSYLISWARENYIDIIDTPLRLFRTSSFWNHIDKASYKRHLSPISGKLDNQRTAGLIIPDAYPCYSTCSKGPNGNDKIGCKNQCLTDLS